MAADTSSQPNDSTTSPVDTMAVDTPKRPKLTGRAFYESLGSPKYILAPMVDQSEFAWRLVTRSFLPTSQRASILAYTPMLHARLFKHTKNFRDHHFQPLRSCLHSHPPSSHGKQQQEQKIEPPYLDGNPTTDRPLIVQFCANDPQDLLQAAQYVSPHCDAVDLNLGCPQGIARKGHYGSFLQESPSLIQSMISTLAENLDVPVTAKMRILDTREETLRYARMLLDAGASWIAVHGRRREQKGHETGLADWSMVRYLRDQLPRETVIFANGNILGIGDLDRCLEATGADGVMSAEGNLCDPGLFAGDEGRMEGLESGEYWKGRDGRGGWRMDAVVRRYLDILYRHVLEREPPTRTPLFRSGNVQSSPELPPTPLDPPFTAQTEDAAHLPPSKKRKTSSHPKTSSPNLLAIRPHLFHLLRPLLSTHTDIRDLLARTSPGDMPAYELLLRRIEEVTRQGLMDYDVHPEIYDTEPIIVNNTPDEQSQPNSEHNNKYNHTTTTNGLEAGKEQEHRDNNVKRADDDEQESSHAAVLACKRPWWICQSYVRPLPREALQKGSLQLGKKAKRKMQQQQLGMEKEVGEQGQGDEREVVGVEGAHERKREERQGRVERDMGDGVPGGEVAKEAMVCG